MFVYVLQQELPGLISCYHTVVLERWFGILCLCTDALVLIMSVSLFCNFVNMVINFSSIKSRKFLYQISTCHLQKE